MKHFDFNRHVNRDSELCRVLRFLPSISEQGPWLAGGSVWKAIENTAIDHDIDFFFANKEQLEEWIRTIKSIPYVHRVVSEKANRYNVSLSYHIHQRDYNKTIKVQLVHYRYFDSMQDLLGAFDFTACQFGYDGNRLYSGDTSFDDLQRREIIFNNVKDCKATALHLKKYLERGFKVPDKELAKHRGMVVAATNGDIDSLDGNYPTPEDSWVRFDRRGMDGSGHDVLGSPEGMTGTPAQISFGAQQPQPQPRRNSVFSGDAPEPPVAWTTSASTYANAGAANTVAEASESPIRTRAS